MRAIIILGLAWSIVICATPSLADRYVNGAQSSMQHSLLADPSFDRSTGVDGQVTPATDLHGACAGRVITARYDPSLDGRDGTVPVEQQSNANFSAMCR